MSANLTLEILRRGCATGKLRFIENIASNGEVACLIGNHWLYFDSDPYEANPFSLDEYFNKLGGVDKALTKVLDYLEGPCKQNTPLEYDYYRLTLMKPDRVYCDNV